MACMFGAALMTAAVGTEPVKLVYVFSEDCGFCTSFAPKFEQAVRELPASQIERLNVHRQGELDKAMELGAEADIVYRPGWAGCG
ncbi:hypothetical protein NDK47_25765 [Brevibacillus ruminantium]|uniref:Thioredoxin n=1 Tax=Brevibacillus ruminantium TaxID=2950604 RepID=A0ABY4WE93_9BACL|nr:hypothetical protein [Brevibacillus ruminantium]USG65472.1 hypothetical protein NDK47_25765 [Brevibacillus ruminantium]